MKQLKTLTIPLLIISCSSLPDNNNMIQPEQVLVEDNIISDTLTKVPDVIEDTPIEGEIILHQGYELIIGESSQTEYMNIEQSNSSALMTQKECVNNNRIIIKSPKEINLKLSNNNYFTLKKEKVDEQFFGYTFKHYDTKLNIYVLWENWLEAGHPIMVNGSTGKTTIIYGDLFRNSIDNSLTANIGEDIGAGWTPNGIQVLEILDNTFVPVFDFDPNQAVDNNKLEDRWGPVDFKWANNNTIYLECIAHKTKGGCMTLYKVIQFRKLKISE